MMAVGEGAPIEDPATGLFSEAFLRAVLPTRIATARRSLKQLGLVMVQVDADPGARNGQEAPPGEALDSAMLGHAVHRALRDSDIAAGLDADRFAMLLEFTPVEGCVVVAQRFIDLLDKEHPNLVASAGVACYPAHAIDASELFAASTRALEDARSRGRLHHAVQGDEGLARLVVRMLGRLGGRGGCNSYGAPYALTTTGIRIGPGVSTQMACAPALMQQELTFLRLLEQVQRFEIRPDGALVLTAGDGRRIVARR